MIYIGIWIGIGALLISAVTITSTAGINHGTAKRRSIAMKRDAVFEQTRLMIEAVPETEARSRNELSTSLQAAIAEMRRVTRALDEKVNLMRVEMIRRSDLSEAVQGLLVVLDRQENRFKAMLDRATSHAHQSFGDQNRAEASTKGTERPKPTNNQYF